MDTNYVFVKPFRSMFASHLALSQGSVLQVTTGEQPSVTVRGVRSNMLSLLRTLQAESPVNFIRRTIFKTNKKKKQLIVQLKMTYLPAGPGGSAIEIFVDFHLGTQMWKEPGAGKAMDCNDI